jgi:predicted Zn finger-like uncharacterized protein
MSYVHIECPVCGFTKAIPRERLPDKLKSVKCPKCKQSFELLQSEYHDVESISTSSMAEDWVEWQQLSQQHTAEASTALRPVSPASFKETLKRTCEIYRSRMLGLAVLFVLSTIVVLLPWSLLLLTVDLIETTPNAELVIGLTAMILSLIGLSYCLAGMVIFIIDELTLSMALKAGRAYVGRIFWLQLLFFYIYLGGLSLFVLPGLLFSMLFSLSLYVLVVEKDKGLAALIVSSQYVSTRFFNTLSKILFLGALVTIISILPFFGLLVSPIVVPFAMVGLYVIYEDVRRQKDYQRDFPSRSLKLKWLSGASLGYVLVLLPLIMAHFNLLNIRQMVPQAIQSQAHAIYAEVGKQVGFLETGGGIVMNKRHFRAGEEMQVRLIYSDEILDQMLICWVGIDGERKSVTNVQIKNTGFVSVKMKAPEKDGHYEIRLYTKGFPEKLITALAITVQ